MKNLKVLQRCLIIILVHLVILTTTVYPQDPFTMVGLMGDIIGFGKGIGWADYDNDGYPDIYVTNGDEAANERNFLFKNNGDGTFTQITTGEIATFQAISGSCSWGDYDNDNYLDIYIASPLQNYLFKNNGDGTFTRNTIAGPVVADTELSAGCAWGDYNTDGHIDMFVTNGFYSEANNSLYSSNGDGTFAKITGIDLVSSAGATDIGGLGWADYDNDGDLDLYVASGGSDKNYIWRNDGGNNFTKLDFIGKGDSHAGSWGDFDNDGDLDLFVTNYGDTIDKPQPNWLYRNDGSDVFTKITTGEIATDSSFSLGSAWGDIDNDGDLDLFVANDGPPDVYQNFLYINDGNGNFTRNTNTVVTDSTYAFGTAFADYNKDGFLDLYVCRSPWDVLYKNSSPDNGNTNSWINIQCVGTASNKAGIGTKVRVKATINSNVVSQLREISAQTGYGSHNDLRAHFGLGDATIIEELKIEWPSGIIQTFANVAVNQFLTITEVGAGESITVNWPNGGENWLVGSLQYVTWNSTGTSGNVKIDYSTDNGLTWKAVIANTPNDGVYEWTIPADPSTTCLVKVADADGAPEDQSDAAFTISGGTFLLTMVADPTDGGTTDPLPGDHVIDQDSVVDISAIPNSGYEFVSWTGDVSDPNSDSTTVTMNTDKTVTANFSMIPVEITDLRASVQGENILLEWTPPEGVTEYNVYRGTSFDFTPDLSGGTNRIAENISDEDPGTEGVQWSDTGNGADIVGDVNTNYFYRVTDVPGVESNLSNVAGEFDYNLITTGGTDINELVILMDTQNTRTPISTAEQLAQAIPNCTDVYYWSASGQGTVGHPAGTPIEDFPIYAGFPYIVNVSSDVVWAVAGSYSDKSFDLITTSGTDINHIGIPLGKYSIASAEELGQDIPNCTDVYYWSASGQGTVGHPVGTPIEDFPVYPGYPYFVNVTSPTTWPGSGAAPGIVGSETMVQTMSQNTNKGSVGAGVPHTVYGKLISLGDVSRQGNRSKLKAWISGRPNDILTDENVGTGCDGEYWWIGVSNFASNWNVEDSLYIEIIDPVGSMRGQAMVVLTAAGSDQANPIRLTATTSVADAELKEIPKDFVLHPNYPNPFNPETLISYQLPKASYVILKVYSLLGEEITTLVNQRKEAGHHQIIWDGKDELGEEVPSGLYLLTIEADNFRMNRKMIKVQ